MSENEEKQVKITLERHLWPDEVAALEAKKKEKRKTRWIIFLVLVFVSLALGLGIILGRNTRQNTIEVVQKDPELQRFESIYQAIKDNWYFAGSLEADEGNLINRAISGMIGQDYDKHSSYMSSEQTVAFTEGIDLGFVGIGVQYVNRGYGVEIQRVFLDSPADKAGIKIGDIIIKVDGVSIDGYENEQVVEIVRGEEGTSVDITYLRDGNEYTTTCIRGGIENSVYGEITKENIGYVEISQFSSVADKECEKYFNYFKNNGVNKLLLDVRQDGGGYLSAIIGIANLLLDKDQVILTQYYSSGEIIEVRANGEKQFVFDQIVILGDESSASASEALIAALTENNKATFVGTKTYGKSTIQTPTYYSDGSSLKLTTGMWKTPNGNVINGVGITPDISISLPEIYYCVFYTLEENEILKYDMVDSRLCSIQYSLDYLGYEVDRFDGYFSRQTENAVSAYQKDNGYLIDGTIHADLFLAIVDTVKDVAANDTSDVQYEKAIELFYE